MRRLAPIVAATAALLAVGCGAATHTNRPSRPGEASAVTELRSIQQLRSVFEAHDGTPRLLVLASPT